MAMEERDVHIRLCDGSLRDIHFSVWGPHATPFEGGLYHGVIQLPQNFPYSAPEVQLLCESGRFYPYKSICINGYTAWH